MWGAAIRKQVYGKETENRDNNAYPVCLLNYKNINVLFIATVQK